MLHSTLASSTANIQGVTLILEVPPKGTKTLVSIVLHKGSLSHPLVPSVASMILVRITFSLIPDKAILFWNGGSMNVLITFLFNIGYMVK